MSKKVLSLTTLALCCFASAAPFLAHAGTATISWNANMESDIAGYKVYYGISPRTGDCPPGGYVSSIDVGDTPSHIFSNLEDGKTYYFSVTSYDKSRNESCFSPEVHKVVAESENASSSNTKPASGGFWRSLFLSLSGFFGRLFGR